MAGSPLAAFDVGLNARHTAERSTRKLAILLRRVPSVEPSLLVDATHSL